MNKLFKNIGAVILVFFLVSGILILYQSPEGRPTNISLNELVSEINDAKVASIEVSGNTLAIELKEGAKRCV